VKFQENEKQFSRSLSFGLTLLYHSDIRMLLWKGINRHIHVPLSMLVGGIPDDVKDYCKKLIKVVGKGGGFIMAPATALDDAKPENVKAMFDITKEYGVYS
jgi:hypothetical protein